MDRVLALHAGSRWFLLKKNRFSADGQNIAQNCTTMRVVETMLYWTAASPPKEDLQPILREEVEIAVASLKKGKSAEVDNTSRTCSGWRGDHDRCFNRDM